MVTGIKGLTFFIFFFWGGGGFMSVCERVIQLLYLCPITEASILSLKNKAQSRITQSITKKNYSSVYKQNHDDVNRIYSTPFECSRKE